MSKDSVSLRDIYDAIKEFREEVRETYVTKDEFIPVKFISFGLVGLILTAVLTAILTGVVRAW